MNMRRPPGIDMITERIRAGLDRTKGIIAVLIGDHAPAPPEVRVDRRKIGIVLVPIAPTGVRLPYLHKRTRRATTGSVQHPAMHDDPLADWLTGLGIVLDKVVIQRSQFRMPEHRSGDFREGVLQRPQRQPGRAEHAGLVIRRQRRRMLTAIPLDELMLRHHDPGPPCYSRSVVIGCSRAWAAARTEAFAAPNPA